MALSRIGTLASVADDGGPWASVVSYACLDDGTPVLCVSDMAEHGRNLKRDPRASLAVAEPGDPGSPGQPDDPSDSARATVAGAVELPEGDALEQARAAFVAAVPAASGYSTWDDFRIWCLRVERVRWVGGFARMGSAAGADYASAELDPVVHSAAGAIAHLNADHADALLAMARALGGQPAATEAQCIRIDRYGLDLQIATPDGRTEARVEFAEPVVAPDGLRAATVELAQRARLGLAAPEPTA